MFYQWKIPEVKPGYKINALVLIGLILLGSAGIIYVTALAMQYQRTLTTSGITGTMGLLYYSDAALTLEINSLDWGVVAPGSVTQRQIYIKNTGNVPVTLLLEPNWPIPSQAAYFTYDDDYLGQTINPGASLSVTFGIQAAADLTGLTNFGFDIVMTATQV